MTKSDIGVYGLGTMGSALALNLAEKGFDVAVSNRETDWIATFLDKGADLKGNLSGHKDLGRFVAALKVPRTILFMIPSGAPMDDMIETITPLLSDGDTIIDGGNADFNATRHRAQALDGTGIHFVGMGVSGGAEGARHGPSMMVGGTDHSWAQFKPMAEAIAASFEGHPCVAHLGPDGAGHFVKTVHNGIEYADMQMIAEVYGILRDGHGMDYDAIGDVFAKWNEGPLESYLIEISGKVAKSKDVATGAPLLSVIVDAAGQKGTGRWTVIEGQHRLAPVPAIEAAVVARNLSARLDERAKGQAVFGAAPQAFDGLDHATLEQGLMAGKILCYAQGFEMLSAATRDFGWDLPMARIAQIWRQGCIIRSSMLDDMASTLDAEPGVNLMFTDHFAAILRDTHGALRQVVAQAALNGHPLPALSSGLAYFDMMRTARGTADMVQGQRDFFGLHGFVHTNGKTDQHGPWAKG